MNLPIVDVIECSCNRCTSACKQKPGWFLPEEIKPAADLLGMTEKDFFEKYLGVDYYCRIDEDFLYVISPAIKEKMSPGEMFPFSGTGECVFFNDGKCGIHSAKPYECKVYDHRHKNPNVHEEVAKYWSEHQDKIKNLIGSDPATPEVGIFDFLEMLKDFRS